MTVTTTLDRVYLDGDGSNKNFSFEFKFFENSQVYVYLINSDGLAIGKTLNVDYTISGAGFPGGGQIQFVTAPPAGVKNVLIRRILSQTQPTSIRNQGAFFPEIHETVFDRLTMLIQQAISSSNTALQLDLAGRAWDFMGRRGINAGDPINAQDVVTRAWMGNYIDGVSGLINTTNGISYDGSTLYEYLKTGVSRTVNSVAALRALSATRNQRAFVLNHTSGKIGGGGVYVFDALDNVSADNDGSVIKGADVGCWKLRPLNGCVAPETFGAFSVESGYPTARADVQFQRIVASGYRLEGTGGTYYVAQVFLESNTDWRRVKLESVGWVGAAGPQSNQSVLTIDGTVTAKRNLYFEDVWVNGRRDLFTNITLSGGEDGRLHAWRIIGDVQNVYGVRCKGINAGTAGLVMHHATPSTTAVQYRIQNVTFMDSAFTGNREHGVFGDSVRFIRLVRCDLTKNGIDIDPAQPIQSGLRGATIFSAGADRYFGGPIDIEGYAVGSGVNQILLEDCDGRGCAVGALFVDDTPSNSAGFVSRSEITVRGGDYDRGVATVFLNPNGKFPLIFQGNFVSGVKPYSLVILEDVRMDGYPWFRGVSKVTATGGFINAANFCAFAFNCDYISITSPCLNSSIDFGGQNSPAQITATKISGNSGTLTSSQSLIRCHSDGGYEQYFSGSTTGVTGPAVLKYQFTAPAGYQIVSAIITARSTSVATDTFYETVAGVCTVWFNPPDDALVFNILFGVCPRLTA